MSNEKEGSAMPVDPRSDILSQARAYAATQRPEASANKLAAFANSVAYLVTGASGGYGGPSVREHAVGHTYAGQRFSYEDACAPLIKEDGLIFGPLQDIHRFVWEQEYCFDDDPDDLEELEGS